MLNHRFIGLLLMRETDIDARELALAISPTDSNLVFEELVQIFGSDQIDKRTLASVISDGYFLERVGELSIKEWLSQEPEYGHQFSLVTDRRYAPCGRKYNTHPTLVRTVELMLVDHLPRRKAIRQAVSEDDQQRQSNGFNAYTDDELNRRVDAVRNRYNQLLQGQPESYLMAWLEAELSAQEKVNI